jgi:hypothetical protein
MLTYVLYYLCRHVESLPCLTGYKFCIQHIGQHSPAPVSHIYVDMLNLCPVLLVISFVYNMTCLHRYDLQEQENVDLRVVYKTYDQ